MDKLTYLIEGILNEKKIGFTDLWYEIEPIFKGTQNARDVEPYYSSAAEFIGEMITSVFSEANEIFFVTADGTLYGDDSYVLYEASANYPEQEGMELLWSIN